MSVLELPIRFKEVNSPNDYDNLSDYQKKYLHDWIRKHLDPCKTKNYSEYYPSSYRLKHYFQMYGGFYVTNGQMKRALLNCGYKPKDYNRINWTFKIGMKADNPKHYTR